MPISTPSDSLESYNRDVDHFLHVLECLFIPAIEASNLQPILPQVAGSDVIHGEIIKNLSSADLVLCDMSQLNANVFFEFGIRTALNKPVALVIDEATANIPFDTGIVNYHRYNSSLQGWLIKSEVKRLSDHINKTLASEPERNSLWKYFGIAHSGFLSTEQATPDDKLSLLIRKVEAMEEVLHGSLDDSNEELLDVPPNYVSAKEDLERIVGRRRRWKPRFLGHKLLAIRKNLGMSQSEMARALELKVHYSAVSNYELGTREPDLIIVLRYARLADVPMEILVDDKLNLPERYENF
ncbi:MAG TPA: helix-turn-helix transcriptional regulator [Pyrinomonadaceae bacterium]|nr:helix-turn-helix transcriptional regulator [Pyrinomonadaceae bacterium]